MGIIICIFMFVLGAIVGSFLNVCIVRLPKEASIVSPPSHCPKCKKNIKWYDNIPLLSYIFLMGRCRFCKERISFRYFFVELITAISFTLFYLYFGGKLILVPYLVMLSCFIVATFVDIEHRIIPDEISIGGMLAGLFFSFLMPNLQGIDINTMNFFIAHLKSFGMSMLGVLVGGGVIYLMGVLGDLLFKKESMGGGDIKLLAMIGAFLGWKYALLTFFIAPFFGSIFGIIEKIRTKETVIAYGPFLALGAIISLFWGNDIIAWLLQRYGIPAV